MANIIFKNISKVYNNGVSAVKNFNLDIQNEDFVVFVGPSGCGKSTTLRMLAGLEEITDGEILIDGEVVNNISPKDRNIAMVFQNYALYPHMTVYENMAFGLKLRKMSKKEIEERVVEAANILGLTNLLDRKPSTLSGGQRQRVALGRAIVRKPKVFLFDEPLSNLDAKLRVQMRSEISKLHKKLNATIVYVTHDQVEAMTMGSKIIVLNEGQIQQIDTPINLYENPKTKFVAEFIGSPSINFIDGRITSIKSNSYFLDSNNLKIELPKNLKVKNCKSMYLGIRPENISISKVNIKNSFKVNGSVDVVEQLGNEQIIYFTANKHHLISRIPNRKNKIVTGENYDFYFDLNKIHYFTKEGNNLNLN